VEADDGSCSTAEEYMEELEVIQAQTKEEDRELVDTILSNNIF
jgi:uncharacterized protein with PIN domain